MRRFTFEKLDAIKGKLEFFQLVVDGVGQIDDFEQEIKGSPQYQAEFRTMLTYMDCVSNLQFPPISKFKDITPAKEKTKEYEFKSKHLRAYAFPLEKKGKVIVLIGYKNTQKEDINRFRNLKNEILKTYRP